ncbi:MAG: CHAT domain-containing protein, partial [Bacteroidota bacterium]
EGNYTTALNVYFTESLFPIPKEIQPWDKTKIFSRDKKESTFYFMVMGYYANVFFNKYKSVGNIDDLNFAKELLDSAKLYITNETKINDEDRLLSVFRNSNSIYDLDIQLNYKLYDLTKNFSYVENVFKSSEESKLKILYSLLQLKESTKNKGVKLQKTIDSLIIHERDTEAIINLKDRIDLLKIRHTPQKNELLYHQVSDKLGTDEVVIDYNIIGEEIFIHYLYKDTSLLYQMPYEDEEKTIIDTLISLQKDSTSEQEIINYYAHQAFNLLFPHRILPYQVAIIPDEELLKLSFDLLIDSTSNYLLDNHLISTSGSASQYTSLHQEGSKNIKTVAGFFFSDIPSILTAHRTLKELPANVEEAKNLKEMVPNSLIFSGKNNSRVNFLNALISGRYQVIHLATHGYASEIHAKDIRLYFRDEDYNLDSIYAFNLMDKTVNTDLVILSSCDSGSGLYFHGEGKYDWARYFILAGSKGVITSLWKVDDNASKLIFNTFYALQGQSYMEKLRAAKIRLKSIADYNHPYYWAGFTYST